MLRGSNPNWSPGKRPCGRSGTTSCAHLSLSLSLSFLPPHSYRRILLVCLRIPIKCKCFSLINCTFRWVRGSVSSQRHMLASKTNEHVHPNVVQTFFSFSSLAVAHRSLSPICFPNISHKSDLSRTVNTKLPMFHPEWFQRRLKLVLFMARAQKDTSRGQVV